MFYFKIPVSPLPGAATSLRRESGAQSQGTSTKVQHKYRKHTSTTSQLTKAVLDEMIDENPDNIFCNQYQKSNVCNFWCKCRCPATSAESCRSVSLSPSLLSVPFLISALFQSSPKLRHIQNFQMEPVLIMVHNPAPHLRTIQEKAFMEVILGVLNWKTTTFSYSLIDAVLECAKHVLLKYTCFKPFHTHQISRWHLQWTHKSSSGWQWSLRQLKTRPIASQGS